MKKSLQRIEDFYIQKGFTGEALRQATENDADYRAIRDEKYAKLTKAFKVSEKEKQKYTLSTDQDYEILGKIHILEKLPLPSDDKKLVALIGTQLEHHWREPLIKKLDEILKRYK